MQIAIKRVYEAASEADGFRVLVDKVWPRGIRREEAAVDMWAKDVTPSTALRKWFNHAPEKWEDFKERYKAELEENHAAVRTLAMALKGKETVTLVYGARDIQHNQAIVLREILASAMMALAAER